MKFVISRTSSCYKKPCIEAREGLLTHVDCRTVKTLEEARLPKHAHWANEFFARGTNHREENGMIARDMPAKSGWVIGITSLDDLVRFQNEYGDLVIKKSDYKEIALEIEIYDDWRE